MAIEDGLLIFLNADAGIAALVGSRIYPMTMPPNPTLPAITYQKISGVRGKQLSGTTGYARPVIQIDSWGDSYGDVKGLADAVRVALDGYQGLMGTDTVDRAQIMNEIDNFDGEVETYRVIQDYEIWHNE